MFLIVLALILVVSIIAPFLLMGMGANAATVSGTEAARYATLAASYGYQQVLQKIEGYYPNGTSSSTVPSTTNPIMLTTSPQALLQALQGYSSEQSITSISGDSFSVRVPAYSSSTNTYTIGITGTYLPTSGSATQATTDVLLSFSPFGVTMQGNANLNIQSTNQSLWVAGANVNDEQGTITFSDSSNQTIYSDGNQYYGSEESVIKNYLPVESTGKVNNFSNYITSESYKNTIDSSVLNQFPSTIPPSPFYSEYQPATGQNTVVNDGSTTTLNSQQISQGYYSGNVDVTNSVALDSNDFVVNGNLTIEPGESLTIDSGNLLVGGNVTVDSGGSITVSSGDACMQGSLTLLGGSMNVSSKSLYVHGDINASGSSANLTVSSGNLIADDNITINGCLLTVSSENLYQGFSLNSSMLTVENQGSISVSSHNIYSNGGVELSGSPLSGQTINSHGSLIARGLFMTNSATGMFSSGSVYVDGLSSPQGSAPTMLTGLSRTAP